MLHVHFAHRVETLQQRLLQQLDEQPADLFSPAEVVVPSTGVQRALTLAVADRTGVCAGVRWAFLAPWLWQQVRQCLPLLHGRPWPAPPGPGVALWSLYAALGDTTLLDAHPRLRRYLQGGQASPRLRFELAQALVPLLDSLHTYRPDWIGAWCRGEAAVQCAELRAHPDAGWIRALALQQVQRHGLPDPMAVVQALQALPVPAHPQGDGADEGAAPAHLFALPSIAPLHLALLRALARRRELHLYLLNPCREYWFEISPARRVARLALRAGGETLGHEVGHPLLAAWGRQTQAFLGSLLEGSDEAVLHDDPDDPAHPDDSPPSTVLQALQHGIVMLQPPQPGAWAALPAGDRSLELHACHSLTRQLEVLLERLLGWLGEDLQRHPGQVLVVLPQLDEAAALVDAVFGTQPPERALPYTLSGRSRGEVNTIARALLDALALLDSRAPVSALLAWLGQPPVARRFGLDEEQLEDLAGRLREAGAHWGLDEAHAVAQGAAAGAAHTLAAAMERLFLGLALPDDAAPLEPLAGVLPVAAEPEALAALAQAAQALNTFEQALRQAPTPREQLRQIRQALGSLLRVQGEEREDLAELLATLGELEQALCTGLGDGDDKSATAQAPLPLALWRQALQAAMQDAPRGGVPTGRITFTSANSLRGLAYPFVAVLGLEDGVFPAVARPPEFDLLSAAPRRGDRQRRDDDRALFLDLLMSARQALHLSWNGRSQRDNARQPPSVLLAELMEACLPALQPAGGADAARAQALQRLRVEHPLHPFSAQAFRPSADPRQRSHDPRLAAALAEAQLVAQATPPGAPTPAAAGPGAAAAGVGPNGADDEAEDDESAADDAADDASSAPPFFTAALPAPEAAWREPELGTLVDFFRHPCRAWLRRRLRLQLPFDEPPLEDDEPLAPERRATENLAERLMPALLAGASPAQVAALAEALPLSPPGALGSAQRAQAVASASRLARAVHERSQGPLLPPAEGTLPLRLDGEDWRLRLVLHGLQAQGLVRWQPRKLSARPVLEAWLHHLALCQLAPPGVQPHTCWLLTDAVLEFSAPPDAAALWAQLLALYRRGLMEPLHFFPKSAWAYMDKGLRIEAARAAWARSDDAGLGEGADAAHRLALRGLPDPLRADGEFEALAQAVFAPLLQQLQVEVLPA